MIQNIQVIGLKGKDKDLEKQFLQISHIMKENGKMIKKMAKDV